MSTITEYEIDTHGIDYPDYFQGAGVSFTRFDNIQTGIGDTELEALNDAIEQIAMSGADIPAELEADAMKADCSKSASDVGEDAHWYVSVRYNLAE